MLKKQIFVTVDAVVFYKSKEILLIKRKNFPFKNFWALPGGHLEPEECLLDAAKRELKEETGMKISNLQQAGIFDDPKRDPRGRSITIVYKGHANKKEKIKASSDAKEVRWFPIKKLPKLAFDHKNILRTIENSSSARC